MSEPATGKPGLCEWPIAGCHVWSYGIWLKDGEPCRCGKKLWRWGASPESSSAALVSEHETSDG